MRKGSHTAMSSMSMLATSTTDDAATTVAILVHFANIKEREEDRHVSWGRATTMTLLVVLTALFVIMTTWMRSSFAFSPLLRFWACHTRCLLDTLPAHGCPSSAFLSLVGGGQGLGGNILSVERVVAIVTRGCVLRVSIGWRRFLASHRTLRVLNKAS